MIKLSKLRSLNAIRFPENLLDRNVQATKARLMSLAFRSCPPSKFIPFNQSLANIDVGRHPMLNSRIENICGTKTHIFSPKSEIAEELPNLLYFHGGGWVMGDVVGPMYAWLIR